jgi:hypothetical protein
MADLSELQAAQTIKIAGANASAVETNFADVNSDGSLKIAGTGTAGTPSTNVVTVQGIASGTGVPISAASLPLPTGAATSANQATEISSLSSIDTKLTTTNTSLSNIDAGIPAALGQTTMAASMPVTIASNQTAIPISGSITATNPSVGTVGAAVPTSATTVGGIDLSGNLQDILVDTTGVQITTDRNNISMVYSSLTVGTTAVEVKVGGSALANRKLLIIHNNSGNTMYWGANNSVTTSNGIVLFRDQVVSIPVGPAISIWIISGSSSQNARITEMS